MSARQKERIFDRPAPRRDIDLDSADRYREVSIKLNCKNPRDPLISGFNKILITDSEDATEAENSFTLFLFGQSARTNTITANFRRGLKMFNHILASWTL